MEVFKVSFQENKIRIDRWLRRKFKNLPQSFFEKKLRKGIIRLNNKIVRSNTLIKENDLIKIKDFDKTVYAIKTKNIAIAVSKNQIEIFNSSIIFQNNEYLILNKWKNIATQGGSKIKLSLNDILKSISENMNLVHRLDKDTSGAIIISKNYLASRIFGSLFKERKVKKVYFAICNNRPLKKFGVVKMNNRKNESNDDNKKSHKESYLSVTRYRVISFNKGFSSILFSPITGRMHQIRRVAEYLGCSIVGDRKYNKKNFIIKNKKCLMLHSYYLSFNYNNQEREYYAKFPAEIEKEANSLGLKIVDKNHIEKMINI
ncbi:MAG: Ribosomal large subunit pseudouridine synthase C [Alphaproteobacteria bacterium MarineAlpha5_Bin11]|nr:MAG: Ribosomal large subunit pseudouridine synthase C [Alphaproteobacteria bacterium MarineAlpha5_Bin11]PPR51745.1 MAG: Ribosomal large subunit pseudouridine synthase C [Alphaproteobacteria bacterium MarineAlpha5_Bin10]